MTCLRIVRSNGSWFIQDDKGTQKVPKFYPTLEEARGALEEYIQKLEIAPPIKKAEVKRSRK